MLEIKCESGKSSLTIFQSDIDLSVLEIWNVLQSKGFTKQDFYIVHNGRCVQENENIINGSTTLVPKLVGGKGGFGSMLRAIGAQIEKTTNREACRDLSGRRLRDINEEKRLKTWIENQGVREVEAAERKKKKLERLCAEPKHTFKDKSYEQERSALTDRIDDAVEAGFKNVAAGNSNIKEKTNGTKKGVKRKTILDDMDSDFDELSSSSDSDELETTTNSNKKLKTDDSSILSAEENSSESNDQSEDKNKEDENSKGEDNASIDQSEQILAVNVEIHSDKSITS